MMLILLAHLLTLALELRVPRPHLHTVFVFALVMASSWFGLHLALAQISELIAFFYLLAWLQLRRGRDLEAGMALGLATTLKLFPGLVLVFFLIARRPRVILGSLISYGFVALVMTARYGLASWPLFFSLQGKTADAWAARLENGSLWGIVLRLFYPGCVGTGPVVWYISLIVMALGVALVTLVWRQSRATISRPGSPDLPFVWFTLVSVFLNPWLWEHYFVLYLLPVAVIGVALRRAWKALRRGERILALGALLLAVWLMHYATGIWAFNGVRDAYKTTPTTYHHVALHLLETVHWIIGPLLQVSVLVLLRAASREPGLFDRLVLPEPATTGAPARDGAGDRRRTSG